MTNKTVRYWGDDVLHGPFYFPATIIDGVPQTVTYYVSKILTYVHNNTEYI